MVWGCSSAGEHFVDIEGVTGSIPVTPTISSSKNSKHITGLAEPSYNHDITPLAWRSRGEFVKELAAKYCAYH